MPCEVFLKSYNKAIQNGQQRTCVIVVQHIFH